MNVPAILRRLHATGVHLGISLLVLTLPLALIFFFWYPTPYFLSDGGLQALIIVSLVHFIIGPVLTFVIFSPNKSKRKMKFDFAVIGALQICALLVGCSIVYAQRPVAIVLAKDKFLPVSAELIQQQGASIDELRTIGGRTPSLVFSRPPADKEEFAQMMLLALNDGIDIVAQIRTFEPLIDHLTQVAENQADLPELESESPIFARELERFLKDRNARREDFVFVPFNGRYKKILFVIDEHGRLAGALRSAYNS